MAVFPRTIIPRTCSVPKKPAPLISGTQGLKREFRQTAAVGVTWRETWPALDMSQQSVREFVMEIQRLWTQGESFTITPLEWRTAAGTLATGTTGLVDGAGQSGGSLVTDGWAAGTILAGDYITVAGIPHALWLRANVTVAAGAATFSIDPPIASGQSPGDNDVVTVNGLLTCQIIEPPVDVESLDGSQFYSGMTLTFGEAV